MEAGEGGCMNKYAMTIGIGMFLFGSIGLFINLRAQTQSKGFRVDEFTLKDGTPCVIVRTSYSGSSPTMSCGWERTHGSR